MPKTRLVGPSRGRKRQRAKGARMEEGRTVLKLYRILQSVPVEIAHIEW